MQIFRGKQCRSHHICIFKHKAISSSIQYTLMSFFIWLAAVMVHNNALKLLFINCVWVLTKANRKVCWRSKPWTNMQGCRRDFFKRYDQLTKLTKNLLFNSFKTFCFLTLFSLLKPPCIIDICKLLAGNANALLAIKAYEMIRIPYKLNNSGILNPRYLWIL